MKLQELNQNEMTEINGGGLLGLGSLLGGNSSASGSQGGLTGGLGLGSLLSLSNESQDGTKTSLSIGNGISLNLGSLFNSLQG